MFFIPGLAICLFLFQLSLHNSFFLMAGQGKQIGALALVLMGVLGACLTCGLPMWRETSFVGANIVTAQSVSRYIHI